MIRPISYADILDSPNSKELMDEYAAECSSPELGRINPNREMYAVLENSGGFQAFGVYDGDILIGFACVLVYVLPHYSVKIATTESIFISDKYRNSGLGDELMDIVEFHAREVGCEKFIYSAPVGSRFSKLLGYRAKHCSNVFVRKL